MRSQHQSTTKKVLLVVLDERFTSQERARLRALRQRFNRLPVPVELGLDPQRLQFARWLVKQGKLRETL
jgi:hypothetical protein